MQSIGHYEGMLLVWRNLGFDLSKGLLDVMPPAPPDAVKFADLQECVDAMGLVNSAKQLDRIHEAARRNVSIGEFGAMCADLRQRIIDELDTQVFLSLPRDRVSYYENSTFPAAVTQAFPAATLDIEEAAKCFATGRFTASVFHLMRVMEHGLRPLAQYLGIANPDFKTWDAIVKKMTAEVDNYAGSSFKGNLDFLRQMLERLTAVRLALRNEIMHARAFYDEERATDIYRSVRAFMIELAKQLKESQIDDAAQD